jgi:hypothetical protein
MKVLIASSYLGFVCRRWIIAGAPGSILRLSWLAFSLEESAGCRYDYVAVYDNSSSVPGLGVCHKINNMLNDVPLKTLIILLLFLLGSESICLPSFIRQLHVQNSASLLISY